MRRRSHRFWTLGALMMIIPLAGCSWRGPAVWTASVDETLRFEITGLERARVETHNGRITVRPLPPDQDHGLVLVEKKTGGYTLADAQAAMEALEVYAERQGETARIGYRWTGIKRAGWRAQVSFDVQIPPATGVRAETHNGPIKVRGLDGDVVVETHNGEVEADCSGRRLYAQTHNGGIWVKYDGPALQLLTHNGRVEADLAGCSVIDGTIKTYNGTVAVTVGQAASFRLNGETHNGRIECRLPLNSASISGRRIHGVIGAGEGRLNITTHNGAIRLNNGDKPVKSTEPSVPGED